MPNNEQSQGSAQSRTDAEEEGARDHPLEESQKSYGTILQQEVVSAKEELERPALGLILSALTAGLDVGFGPFAMAVLATGLRGTVSEPVLHVITTFAYSLGFVFVVLGHSALFTEHTTSAVLPVLEGKSSVAQLARLWGLVLFANVVGCALFAWFGSIVGPRLGVTDVEAFDKMARTLVDMPSLTILLSAIGAGWLMGLLSWLTTAGRDTTSQVLLVFATTFVIGIANMHHSIAGTVEVLLAVFSGTGVTMGDYGRFLLFAAVGNAIGGVVFVAGLKWGHVQQSAQAAG